MSSRICTEQRSSCSQLPNYTSSTDGAPPTIVREAFYSENLASRNLRCKDPEWDHNYEEAYDMEAEDEPFEHGEVLCGEDVEENSEQCNADGEEGALPVVNSISATGRWQSTSHYRTMALL